MAQKQRYNDKDPSHFAIGMYNLMIIDKGEVKTIKDLSNEICYPKIIFGLEGGTFQK